MAEPLSKYIATLRERGITSATVLGKGPSLDHYKPIDGEYVIGCNDVAKWFRCDAAIFIDTLYNDFPYSEDLAILRPADRAQSHNGRGYMWNIWQPGHPETDDYLKVTGKGTGTKTLQILGLTGVTDITLWGFDGIWAMGYARCLNGESPNPKPGTNYPKIGLAMLEVAKGESSSIQRIRHGVPSGPISIMEPTDG